MLNPQKYGFDKIMDNELFETYKDLNEIRSMISVGNSFIPIIVRHNRTFYTICFELQGNGIKYELVTQKRGDRQLEVKRFKCCDTVLLELERLGFHFAIVRFNQS
jgi:hypothetical protein